MKPVDQTLFGAPLGNCFFAAVASILDLPLTKYEIYPQGVDVETENDIATGKNWWAVFTEWLHANHGLHPTMFLVNEFPNGSAPKGYSIISGDGPRGLMHSTVGRDGWIIHDPHPSRAGLLRKRDYIIFIPLVEVK